MPASILVRAPKFGAWLQLQRGDRSLEQIAIQVRHLIKPTGLKVDQSQIFKIEDGRIPSWPILLALAQVYALDQIEMLANLLTALEFPGADDLRQKSTGRKSSSDELERSAIIRASDPSKGDSHDRAPSALHADLLTIVETIEKLQGLAGQLLDRTAHTTPPTPSVVPRQVPPGRVRRGRLVG